jgi:hypothetical protein
VTNVSDTSSYINNFYIFDRALIAFYYNCSLFSIVTRLRTSRVGFDSQQGQVLSSLASRLALDPIQFPVQWVPEVKRTGFEACHIVPTLRICGAVPPLPHT